MSVTRSEFIREALRE
ncbi:hypothetical protein K5D32_18645 [Pseudomonas cichorii]|nr:hypothetical protein [Pseudomonas cichorii]